MSTGFVTPRGIAGQVTGTGRQVLLVHGGPGMTDYMGSLLPELTGYRVATFQQRGVAPSTLEGPFDVPTLRDDVLDVLDSLEWPAPAVVGHSWGGHLLLHLMVELPERVGAALLVDPLGAVGDGGIAELATNVWQRLPEPARVRLEQLESASAERGLTTGELAESMQLALPAYFSGPEAARPLPQAGQAPTDETWASIHRELPALADGLRACAVPARFVHGERDPLPVSASRSTAEILGAPVDVLSDNGHFPWLEEPGCVRRSLDRLLADAP